MYFRCHYQADVCHNDDSTYITTVYIDVREYDEPCALRYTLGRIVIDKILWGDALRDGVPVFEVFDGDSQGLYEVHRILSRSKDPQELRPDLNIQEPISEVLFVHRVVLGAAIKGVNRIAVLNAALRAVTREDAVAVLWNNADCNTEFTEKEYAHLGFAKIAGENLIYRDLHFQSLFEKKYPRGKDILLTARPAHERQFRDEWRRLSKGQ